MLNDMDPTAVQEYCKKKVEKYCLNYKHKLELDVFLDRYFHLDDTLSSKLDIVNQLLDIPMETIANTLQRPDIKKSLSSSKMSWIVFIFIVLTCFVSVPLLMLRSWYYLGSVNFLKPDFEIVSKNILSLLNDYEKYKQKRAETNKGLTQPDTLQPTPVRNTPVENVSLNQTQAPSNPAPQCTAIIPYNPIQFIPVKRPPLQTTPTAVPSSFSAFFPSVGQILSQDFFLRETGKPVVIDSRIRPFNEAMSDVLVIDVYCKFRFSHQKPMTMTLSFMMNLDSSWQQRPEPEPELEQEPQSLVSQAWSSLNQGYLFFVPERNFQRICEEAKHEEARFANSWWDPLKLYKEALSIAQNNKERVIAITGIIDSLAKKYDTQDPRSVTDNDMDKITNEINNYINKLPMGFQLLSSRVAGLKIEFATIFKLLHEEKIGEAAFIYRHLKNYSPFIKYACPNLYAMYDQMHAIFFLIQIPGYSALGTFYIEYRDDQLRKERMCVYIKDDLVWCAMVTPSGLIKRIPLEKSELGVRANEIHAYLKRDDSAYYGEDITSYETFSSIMFDAIAPKGYFQRNVYGLVPLNAFRQLQSAYEQLKTYDADLAELFYQKSLAPIQLLMRACQYAGEHTPKEVQIRELALDDQECNRRRQADEVYPSILEQIDDARWTSLLNDTEQNLKGIEIPEDRNFDFSPIWPF